MRQLTAAELVAAWEAGAGASAAERPLALLCACVPERSRDELAALPVGDRDGLLVALHRTTFGPLLQANTGCPVCAERVEFSLAIADLPPLPELDALDSPPPLRLRCNGVDLEFRLPDSRDLMAIATAGDVDSARAALVDRCVIAATQRSSGAAVAELAEPIVAALAAELARQQPWADLEAELVCPSCSATWTAPLDAGEFVWAEIAAEARRLLREVDVLARTYGWREADILAMSTARRAAYLELAG